MPKVIQNGGFSNPLGQALTGNLLLLLSQDAKSAANPNQVAPIATRIPISGGNIAATSIYFNDELLPNNTYYTMTAYDSAGNKTYGPEIVSFTGAGPLDLGTLVPLLISPDPLFSNPVLQNPAQAQTITGFGLTLTSSAPMTVQGNLSITGGVFSTTQQLVSSLVTGTPPFSVASTTNIPNLNASLLNGATFAAPGTIGSTTPGAATFTIVNKRIYVDQQVGATADVQISNCYAALPATGGTCDATGYGATTQTLAANVTFSATKPVELIFDKATTLSVSGTGTTPFTIAEGTSISNATFSLPASYAVPVITNTGNIGANQNSKTRLTNITCTGTDTTAGGGCVGLSVSTGFIDALTVTNVQVFKLSFGLKISVTGSGFINGNTFNGGWCSLTTNCHQITNTSTGQISLNTFISWYEEMSTTTGQQYISGSCTGSGPMNNNRWFDAKIFDPPGGNPTIMTMPSACAGRWTVEGFLNLGVATVADSTGVATMCDSSIGGTPCFNTGPSGTGGIFIPVYNSPQVSQTRQGFINVDSSSRFLFQSQANTFRFLGPAGQQIDLNPTGTGSVYIRVAGTPQRAETGADTNLLTFTPPAVQGDYWACVQMAVSAANTATLGWTITYKDSNGTAQAPTNLALSQIGVAAPALTFAAVAGANGNYSGCWNFSIDNSATAIVVKTTFSGTSIAYKATASIGIQQ